MKNHGYRFNMVVYTIKNILSVLFPLITFPYVSRVLGVENLGRYNFSTSIVGYFALIAALGINTFAVREGVKIKGDKEKFERFAGEIFGISIISTILAYLLLVCYLIFSAKAKAYAIIILIYACTIILTTLGREWIFIAHEEYTYITLRFIVVHLISILLLFVFVRDVNDLIPYTIISVVSSSGANLFNLVQSRKYTKIRIIFDKNTKKYLKSIFYFFAATVATTIYVNSDTTMLGYLCDDYQVGLYSVSVKIYTIIKTVLASLVTVTIPRIASLVALGETKIEDLKKMCRDTMNILFTFLLPVLCGIVVVAEDLILVISGKGYIEATGSLQLLSLALAFCVIGYFWGDGILVAYGREKILLIGTAISAAVNIGLNFILIPLWQVNAAALTTVIAEFISSIIFIYFGRKCLSGFTNFTTIFKSATGCVAIVGIGFLTHRFIDIYWARLIVTVVASVVAYFIIEYVLKNEFIISTSTEIVRKIKRREKE